MRLGRRLPLLAIGMGVILVIVQSLYGQVRARMIQKANASLRSAITGGPYRTLEVALERGADRNLPLEHGHLPLHYAIQSQWRDAATLLLREGADPNRHDLRGYTPLILAVQLDDRWAIDRLLQARSDPNRPDRQGRTPLHWAELRRNPGLARRLTAAGARPSGSPPDQRDDYGLTRLMRAAKALDLAEVRRQLARGASVNLQSDLRDTALILGITSPAIVKVLLEHGADPELRDAQGRTALLHAAISADRKDVLEITRMLLRHGARVTSRDRFEKSVMMYAVHQDYPPLLELLVRHGADLDARDAAGHSALSRAVELFFESAGTWLLRKGADPHVRSSGGVHYTERIIQFRLSPN